ncbi:hypothetical protein LTR60_005412, partial [Cryomyces antarcticus]
PTYSGREADPLGDQPQPTPELGASGADTLGNASEEAASTGRDVGEGGELWEGGEGRQVEAGEAAAGSLQEGLALEG